ncbi:aldehyde dehydrogenase (NAD(P)+) [Nakamurella panacisegetis]|uniref:Aldehyde dehydrogenase (NAD(P)+) n=1 Tax=Nakamurella panacisegetis TaxID=1090615 RepID=A0A1H0J0C8_9ACTN|nr:aldehyde dehydrogenase family protein [Nakamurella panacisegetis]SDO37042.1 aldehyde dehydrogenase (NAD(P)+) [Nakamurella panacisegetis]
MTAQLQHGTEELDSALSDLVAGAGRWTALPLSGRLDLLSRVSTAVSRQADDWVRVAASYKGLEPSSSLVGEEWTSGPYAVLSALTALTESLRALESGRSPVDDVPIGSVPGNRVAVKVLPHNLFDSLLLSGYRAEVWMRPGIGADDVRARAGLGQLTPSRGGGVGLVLGAGNITSIPVLDVLYELFAHNRVVLLKLNPITETIAPVFQSALQPLVAAGFLRIVTGGADVGQYLVHHDLVDHVHITGSALSHDAIVFGGGVEGAARKAAARVGAAEPLLDKEITSELGGVSPIIIVPGRWSKADLRFQAEHIATQRLHNGGYNCIAGQVVVLSSDWPQRGEFLAQVRSALSRAPQRAAYYPGSDQRVAGAKSSYPSAETLPNGRLLITGIGSADGEKAMTTEYFAPVLAVTELPGSGLDFLRAAVATANEKFAGTLGVNVIAHPRTLRAAGAAFEEALADLRYGCIAVNAWTGFGFLTARATWGAFPGHTLTDVQSGIGLVHNALLLDDAERTVVRGPFRPWHRSLGAGEFTLSPRPPWFVTNRTQATTGRRLTAFAANPSWVKLPGIFASALRG